jgi:ANTAR domain
VIYELGIGEPGRGRNMEPSHHDPMLPEDHDAIKREELEALEREVNGLKTALGTRTIIGKAIGVIIEREGVNETEAFEMLKTMSQHTNVRLRDVAARLAEKAQPTGKEEPEEAGEEQP